MHITLHKTSEEERKMFFWSESENSNFPQFVSTDGVLSE